MTCFSRNIFSPQGMGYIQFHELAHSMLRQLAIDHKVKTLYNVNFKTWCEDCTWKLKPDPYITYRTYKLIKRHALHNPDHCVHCDPEGDVIIAK